MIVCCWIPVLSRCTLHCEAVKDMTVTGYAWFAGAWAWGSFGLLLVRDNYVSSARIHFDWSTQYLQLAERRQAKANWRCPDFCQHQRQLFAEEMVSYPFPLGTADEACDLAMIVAGSWLEKLKKGGGVLSSSGIMTKQFHSHSIPKGWSNEISCIHCKHVIGCHK